jgi:hypothetical protein
MGKKPRLVSVLMLGLGVAFLGCNSTNSAKDKSTFKGGGKDPAFAVNKDATAKQPDNGQFQAKDSTPSIGQPTPVNQAFMSDQASMGVRPNANPALGGDNHLTSNSLPAATPPVTATTNPVAPPPLTGNVQQTNKPPVDPTIQSVSGQETMHADGVVAIPTTDVSPNLPPGRPLPPINTSSGAASSPPPLPVEVPSSAPTFNPPVPPTSGGNSLSSPTPALPPLPPPAN